MDGIDVTVKMKNTDNDKPEIIKAELTLTIGNKGSLTVCDIERLLREYHCTTYGRTFNQIEYTASMPTNIRNEYYMLGRITEHDSVFDVDEKEKWELGIKVK